jgi:hypothetical protein
LKKEEVMGKEVKTFVSGAYRCSKKKYQSELLFDTMARMEKEQKIAIASPDGLRVFQLIDIAEITKQPKEEEMQTYYLTMCREHGTVQEEAVLKSDHIAALEAAVSDAREQGRRENIVHYGSIDVYKQEGKIAALEAENAKLREALKPVLRVWRSYKGLEVDGVGQSKPSGDILCNEFWQAIKFAALTQVGPGATVSVSDRDLNKVVKNLDYALEIQKQTKGGGEK